MPTDCNGCKPSTWFPLGILRLQKMQTVNLVTAEHRPAAKDVTVRFESKISRLQKMQTVSLAPARNFAAAEDGNL